MHRAGLGNRRCCRRAGFRCQALRSDPKWTYEGIAFYAGLPGSGGNCAIGTIPIYRGYNLGLDGVPAHRFSPWPGDACAFMPYCAPEGRGPRAVLSADRPADLTCTDAGRPGRLREGPVW